MSLPSEYEWIFNNEAVTKLLTELGFRERTIEYLLDAIKAVSGSRDISLFWELCAVWKESEERQKSESLPVQWQALAVLSAFPQAIEQNTERGIPWEVTRVTLFDFDRRMEESFERFGEWKFRNLGWFRNHVNSAFFQIGRLQYIPGPFGYDYRTYRNLQTGNIVTFAAPGTYCTAEGWPSYEKTEKTAFETAFEESQNSITGHPVKDNGGIASSPIRVSARSSLLLDKDSNVLQMHIPWGDKLGREQCVDSLKKARQFYAVHFPEITIHAFRTATWLLDRELEKVLPPTSNILEFGRLFHPLASRRGDDKQLLERVFNCGSWQDCVASNSLQRSILKHHKNGGKFRLTAGFILTEEVEEL